jgi:hypothetical protein
MVFMYRLLTENKRLDFIATRLIILSSPDPPLHTKILCPKETYTTAEVACRAGHLHILSLFQQVSADGNGSYLLIYPSSKTFKSTFRTTRASGISLGSLGVTST